MLTQKSEQNKRERRSFETRGEMSPQRNKERKWVGTVITAFEIN
jgi:hypothetical protein